MSPSTVLIVSAEPATRDLYVRTLAGTGEIYTASAGSEALERMRNDPADLVITAEMLPDMSAADLCRLIKTEMGEANPQVILLSGNGNGECYGADASFDTRAELSHLRSLAGALLRARAAEERLATMQDRANQFFETVRGGSFELDQEWRIIGFGGAFSEAVAERSAGRSWSRFLGGVSGTPGHHVRDAVPPGDGGAAANPVRRRLPF